VRVIRWNHSGSPGALQHDPIELDAVPRPDPATGGLRAGVAEDFPNGGGGRAFLFIVGSGRERVTLLWINSGSAADLDMPIVVDGRDHGAPAANLVAALAAERIDRVDLAILPGGAPHADRVAAIARPRVVIPHHWDGLYQPFLAGVPFRFADADYEAALAAHDARLVTPEQYLDAWTLDVHGLHRRSNHAMKHRFDFTAPPSILRAGIPCCS
jgi:hypothetical protein